jgi:hypothetical protein
MHACDVHRAVEADMENVQNVMFIIVIISGFEGGRRDRAGDRVGNAASFYKHQIHHGHLLYSQKP